MDTVYMFLGIGVLVGIALFQLGFFDTFFPQKQNYEKKEYNFFELVGPGKIFTPTEQKFFCLLKQSINTEKYNIFTKVRLVDVIYLKHAPKDKYMPIFNKVSKKHLDFVITDGYGKVLLVIELDDKYHNRERVKINDKFKNDIFEYIGVPLKRFQVGSYYDFNEIKKLLV